MKFWRRPRNTTIFAIMIFLVSFGFWLNQPQPERNFYQAPDVSWVIVTTTVAPGPETTLPVETTISPETLPPETVPTETVPIDGVVETTVVPTSAP